MSKPCVDRARTISVWVGSETVMYLIQPPMCDLAGREDRICDYLSGKTGT